VDSHPLPNIEDNLSRLSRSCVYSTLDGAGAYHVVPIKKQDRDKTAFGTPWGSYQFRRMPFGLCNAPATYCRLVQMVLQGIPYSMALPYLDDTCVHSRNLAEHFTALQTVLEAFRKAGLKLQPKKCFLFKSKVEYLGHIVSKEGIGPVPQYKFKLGQAFGGKQAMPTSTKAQLSTLLEHYMRLHGDVDEKKKSSDIPNIENDGDRNCDGDRNSGYDSNEDNNGIDNGQSVTASAGKAVPTAAEVNKSLRKSINDMTADEARDALFASQLQSHTAAATPTVPTVAAPGRQAMASAASQPLASHPLALQARATPLSSLKPVCLALKKGKFCGGCKGFRHPRICLDPLHGVARSVRPRCDLSHLKPASGNGQRGALGGSAGNGRLSSGGFPPPSTASATATTVATWA
jgi:hypothetical protein